MNERKGEKAGWIFGWLGGFLWVIILSTVLFFQEKRGEGAIGFGIFILALAIISIFAPWKMPATKFWKVSLLPYSVFLFSIIWAVWAFGGLKPLGLTWWNFSWIIPIFIPIITMGNRRWIDGEPKEK